MVESGELTDVELIELAGEYLLASQAGGPRAATYGKMFMVTMQELAERDYARVVAELAAGDGGG